MRFFVVLVIALSAFLGGILVSSSTSSVGEWFGGTGTLKCIAHGRVCVGTKVDQVSDLIDDEEIGGLTAVECGFGSTSIAGIVELSPLKAIESKCPNFQYVANFSDRIRITSIWVDHGVIVRIQYGPRHVLDF